MRMFDEEFIYLEWFVLQIESNKNQFCDLVQSENTKKGNNNVRAKPIYFYIYNLNR